MVLENDFNLWTQLSLYSIKPGNPILIMEILMVNSHYLSANNNYNRWKATIKEPVFQSPSPCVLLPFFPLYR